MKISVIGAGNVGANAAKAIADKSLANTIVLFDVVEGMAQGKALDIAQSSPIVGFDCQLIGTCDYADTADSDIVVITAGMARKPGMTREDLSLANAKIVSGIVAQVCAHSPQAILLMVTNPLDVMAQLAYRISGFPRHRVIGMAGVLDTARFRLFIARELGVSVRDVYAFVLGGHGDLMVPCVEYSSVAGVPLGRLLSQEKIDALVKRTKDGGGEIVNLLKTGSAYYAPAAAIAEMVESIVLDKRRVLPTTVMLEGEYGISGVYCGVACKLGRQGMAGIMEIALSPSELAALRASAEGVRAQVAHLDAFSAPC